MRQIVLILLLVSSSIILAADPAPTAQDILEGVRFRQVQQQIDLHGELRQDKLKVPFQLVQTGPTVRYIFTDPDETLQLQIGEKESRLEEVSESGTERVKPADYDHKVRGTDLTYEDLSLKFLYWPNPEVLGSENIRTRNCWKLLLRSPGKQSQYAQVLLWVDKSGGALMRLEAYDAGGRLLKRFEVVSAQKIEDRWFLKEMRIEEVQPGTNHVLSRTYLNIKKS